MTEAARRLGVVRAAIIDNLHLQAEHGIITQDAPKPEGQYARWMPGEQGQRVGIAAVVDLEFMARAVCEALTQTGTMPAEALSAPQEPAQDDDDPFPAPDAPEPAEGPEGTICRHCGTFIERVLPPRVEGWQHVASTMRSCEPGNDSAPRAEP